MSTRDCPHCGAKVHMSVTKCPQCGGPTSKAAAVAKTTQDVGCLITCIAVLVLFAMSIYACR
jgi:hypothetical protein